MTQQYRDNSPMLNAYPDSIGGTLKDLVGFLKHPGVAEAFGSCYILPSLYNTDLDRGFSVIDYNLNEQMASKEDIESLKALGLNLKLDFILNHASVLSPQFQDLIRNGAASEYKDFFIDWNRFWEGCGELTEDGYIQPREEYLKDMFFRKAGLPILMVRMPDGRDVPYWNTFYQKVIYKRLDPIELTAKLGLQYGTAVKAAESINRQLDEGRTPAELDGSGFETALDQIRELLEASREYLGQMDLNLDSPLVWTFYEDTLKKLAGYGASIVRLDAFAYAPKAPGKKNFLNLPDTWELLEKIRQMAEPYGLTLLPEIHATYEEGNYRDIAAQGYMTYDFFLPGLILDATIRKDGSYLARWAQELVDEHIHTVNMLGCHDGIPVLDLKGLLPDDQIQNLIDTVLARGGMIKNLHGATNTYYQVNATYYSALGESDARMLLARAIQLFMPGKPQIWYLDLLAGKNDHEAVRLAGEGGHKEINRTNIKAEDLDDLLQREVVQKQLELLRFRKNCPAFGPGALFNQECEGSVLKLTWTNHEYQATLIADFDQDTFQILQNGKPEI